MLFSHCSANAFIFILVNKNFRVKLKIFSYPSVLTFVLGAQKNLLTETVLLSSHNIFWLMNNKIIINL